MDLVRELPGCATSDYLNVLFDSLTLDQLRLVFASLWQGSEALPSTKSRRAVIQQIHASGGAQERIVKAALEVEASSAMKHCFLGRVMDGAGIETLAAAVLWSDFNLSSIDARVARVQSDLLRVKLTIEHFVISREWREVDDLTKVIEERLVRHPIIISFNKRQSVATIEYPGYSTGSATKLKDKVSYEKIVSSILDALRARFNISVAAFPVVDAINSLRSAGSPRIRLVSADIEAVHGRLSLSTSSENESIAKILSDIVGEKSGLTETELEDIASSFMRRSSTSAMLVFWVGEKIFTRVKFWENGAELLFIWNGQDQSGQVAREILSLISDVSKGVTSGVNRDTWNVIADSNAGAILTPRVLSERTGASAEDCGKILVEAERAALVEPVFRVKHGLMLESNGDRWTRNLSSLFAVHKNGNMEIDGRDPSNIEVAFRRISKECSE